MTVQDIRWIQRFNNFCKALMQLTKFIQKGKLNELEEQGLIQAFEYTHELAWQTLKDFLEYRGNSQLYGSRDATREAFKLDLIHAGEVWMDMIQKRNLTSHTYNEIVAGKIAEAIKTEYFEEFVGLKQKLEKIAATERK